MDPKPLGPLLLISRQVGVMILGGCVLALVVAWLLAPLLFHGFHIGYNPMTDNACMSRIVQWCGHTATTP